MSKQKQQQLVFDKGITNVPSDAVCSDNALEESVGMVYENGEHRVIQNPAAKFTVNTGHKLLFIHYVAGYTNKITVDASNYVCYNGTSMFLANGTDIQVSAVGKTLVVLDNDGLHYFLYKDNGYTALEQIPAIDIEFSLCMASMPSFQIPEDPDDPPSPTPTGGKWMVCNGLKYEGAAIRTITYEIDSIVSPEDVTFSPSDNSHNYQKEYNDLLLGLYAKNKKQIAERKGFCLPFFARAALEMYDGTYAYASNPVLLYATTLSNSAGVYCSCGEYAEHLYMTTVGASLRYKLKTDYTDYSDLVKSVVIFITRGVEIYDLATDQKAIVSLHNSTAKIANISTVGFSGYHDVYRDARLTTEPKFTADGRYFFQDPLVPRLPAEIKADLEASSLFYKLCGIGLSDTNDAFVSTESLIRGHVIENIETQDQLKNDNYYANCPLKPSVIGVYNSRLMMANVERGFFHGFEFFSPYASDSQLSHTIQVSIETDSGTKVLRHVFQNYTKNGLYFYYPDPRAKTAIIDNVPYDLKEHEGLNGAYWMRDIPTSAPTLLEGQSGSELSGGTESLPSTLIQSEVNNPFVFLSSGYYTIGSGTILGFTANTHALSQAQFGQHPVLVFSDSGIWGMTVADTGYFSNGVPMSREVCNNAKSITQTDNAVFFSSEKGLMMIVGKDVRCVSEQLSGGSGVDTNSPQPFQEALKTAVIAYDYRDSLLWIFDGTDMCWIFSIKSGAFAHYDFGEGLGITNIVNDYPDYLLQHGTQIYSLTGRVNINRDQTLYTARMISRPLKLENSIALKTITEIRAIRDMSGHIGVRLIASNNLHRASNTWYQVMATNGVPWLYYKVQVDFSDMLATDRFAGLILDTLERRAKKAR